MLNAASEKKLARVKADLARVARRASEISSRPFQIVQGNRTQAEQNALYAQGRSRPGNIVTWTKRSKHIGGNAVDFAALVNGKINWDTKYYPEIVNAFKKAAAELKVGIEAGYDWKTRDWGHIQLALKNPTPTNPSAGIGWTISDVQNALIKHGFDPGKIDGILGKNTRKALTAFQKAKMLPVTGAPDKETTDALAKASNFVAKLVEKSEVEPVTAEIGSVKWAFQFLKSLGWSTLASTVLVANLVWESGGHDHIVWEAHGDKGKDGSFHSHGAGQWNDRHGRFQDLLTYAQEQGKSWINPEVQLRFIDKELRWNERATGKKLLEVDDLKEAMTAAIGYWRPGVPHADKRLAIAEKLEKEFSDVSDDDVSAGSSDGDA